jgi:hypothetical protein
LVSRDRSRKVAGRLVATAAIAAAATAAAATTAAAAAITTAAATTATAAVATTAAAATAAAATATALALLCDIDAERATLEVLAIELGERLLGAFGRRHLDEAEATRLTAHAIDHDVDRDNLTALGEARVEQVLGGVERKITDVETIRHADPDTRHELNSFIRPQTGEVASPFL